MLGSYVAATPAMAASNGDFSVFPTRASENLAPRLFFFLSPAPGQTVKDSVTISNLSDAPQKLNLYAGDAAVTELGGTLGLTTPEQEPTGVARWIKLSKNEVTLKPGDSADVPFTLSVPRGAAPGDYVGGIAASNFTTSVDSSGATIRQRNAVGARVYVRVQGPLNEELSVEKVELTQVEPRRLPFVGEAGTATLVYRVANVGNVRVSPKGTLTLKGLGGRQLVDPIDLTVPELLPETSVVLTVPGISGLPSIDRVSAEVTLTGNDSSASGSTSAWVVSPLAVVVVAAVVLVLFAMITWLLRRRRRVPSDEPLVSEELESQSL
jgi:hypothetical protein